MMHDDPCGVRVYTETGCGNAVLRIYSNKSTLPTHELCGIPKDKDIVSTGNSVRFKYSLLVFLTRDDVLASAVYAMARCPAVLCRKPT